MYGGSGFVLTKPTYLLLRSYVIKKFSIHSKLHRHGDTQTAIWIKEINENQGNPITYINYTDFFNKNMTGNYLKSGTFHHLHDYSNYTFLSSFEYK